MLLDAGLHAFYTIIAFISYIPPTFAQRMFLVTCFMDFCLRLSREGHIVSLKF